MEKYDYGAKLDVKTKNKLIDLVEQNPILYEKIERNDQKAWKKRKQCWEKIGLELSLPAAICKGKFASIKSTFHYQLRAEKCHNGIKRTQRASERLGFLRKVYLNKENEQNIVPNQLSKTTELPTIGDGNINYSTHLNEKTKFKLIDAVQKYPILYERRKVDTALQQEKKMCWEKVAVEMSLPAKFCEHKFLTITQNFRKKLRCRESRNGIIQPTRLDNKLYFLRKIILEDGEESLNSTPTSPSGTQPIRIAAISNGFSFPGAAFSSLTPEVVTSPLVDNTKCLDTPMKSSNQRQISPSASRPASPIERRAKIYDEDLCRFFSNMEETAIKFSPQLQIKVKRMISDVIYDAEEQCLNEQKKTKQFKDEKFFIDITDE